ncbi:MAG: hypothetical protein IJ411_04970 [Oscillospiraceae bacterium]|nr:hypothetical protein [Oscillospiraceae bacterium]
MIYRSFDSSCGSCSQRFPFQQEYRHQCHPFCCHNFRPMPPEPPQTRGLNILTAVNSAEQTVAPGGTLPFAFNTVAVGSDITHAAGATVVSINTPGVYLVHFNAIAAASETGTEESLVRVELHLNGAAVPGAAASYTFDSSEELASLAFTTALTVTTVPASLTIVLPEDGAIISDSAITVQRLGGVPNQTCEAVV